LKNGLEDFRTDKEKEALYLFLAMYVQKVQSDSNIKREFKSNPGMSFIDMITPSVIVYVISVVKNS